MTTQPMPTPVFQDYTPAGDCACPGCAEQRAMLRGGGHPGARGARRALVLVTAAGVVLGGAGAGGGGAAAAFGGPGPDHGPLPGPVTPAGQRDGGTEQGAPGALHGPPVKPGIVPPVVPVAARPTDRATIINRAKLWLDAKVPYSMAKYWTDGYRQDCSGYVSMAWDLGTNEWTGSLDTFATRITKDELLPGDMLLFHNPADPNSGSHVTLFGGWTDHTRTYYTAYEQTRPHTRRQATPYGYWNNAAKYLPYRYNGVTGGLPAEPGAPAAPGPGSAPGYPGASVFRPGMPHAAIEALGQQLVEKGFGTHYTAGPGPVWGETDRRGVEAFQRAQGWRGAAANGYPGPETWRRLFA